MGMGGLCLIGEYMKNLSELIDKHEEIFGDQSLRITSLPTMTELRMTEDEKRKKQKRDWYHENKEKVLEQHCLLYTSPSPRDRTRSRMPSSA